MKNPAALIALSFGSVLIWSGIKGWSVLGTIQDIVSGKKPAGATLPSHPINAPTSPLSSSGNPNAPIYTGSGSVTQQAMVQDAMGYQGHAYLYGGSPGKTGQDPWDCSSFVNWVVSHDLGLPWPGSGRYDGTTHGPPTGSWAAWFLARGGGSTTVSRANLQAGDIIVWSGHMGIAINSTQMISAETPKNGTLVGGLVGTGPLLCYGRLPGVS